MPEGSAADLVAEALTHCSRLPVSPDSVDAVRHWASQLPDEYESSSGLLELDLAQPQRLDVSLIPGWRWSHADTVPEELRRLADLFDVIEARRPGDPACVCLREAWAEYDIVRPGHAAQAALFVGIEPDHRRDRALLSRVAAALLGASEPTDALDACWQRYALGNGPLQIGYVAAMPGRQGHPVRLNIGGPSAAHLALPGVAAIRSTAMDAVFAASDNLVTCIDVRDDGIGPRWGLELVTRRGAGMLSRTRVLLQRLCATGLLSEPASAALQGWSGGQALPGTSYGAQRALAGEPGTLYAWRTINHLKLVIEPGRPVGLKAYLGFGRRWIPDAWAAAAP